MILEKVKMFGYFTESVMLEFTMPRFCSDQYPIPHSIDCVSALDRFKYPEYRWIIETTADDASLVAS